MSLYNPSLAKSFMLHIQSKRVEQLSADFNTDMKINLDAPIRRTNALQDLHLSLSTAHIPFTFYQFSSNLNNLNIFLDGAVSFVLAEGNYDVYEIIALINASSFPYTGVYNQNTNKITLTNTDATIHTINFSSDESTGLAKNLGFKDDVTVGSGGTTTSTGSVNLQTVHTIYLHSDLALSNVITTETNNYTNIIDSINVDVSPFEIISHGYYESAPFSSVLEQEQLNSFQLSIKDQNNRLLQLNNSNFELSILVEIHNKDITGSVVPQILRPAGRRSLLTDIQDDIPAQPSVPSVPASVPSVPESVPIDIPLPNIISSQVPPQRYASSVPVNNVTTAGSFSGFPPPPVIIPVKQEPVVDGELLDALLFAKQLQLDSD